MVENYMNSARLLPSVAPGGVPDSALACPRRPTPFDNRTLLSRTAQLGAAPTASYPIHWKPCCE